MVMQSCLYSFETNTCISVTHYGSIFSLLAKLIKNLLYWRMLDIYTQPNTTRLYFYAMSWRLTRKSTEKTYYFSSKPMCVE